MAGITNIKEAIIAAAAGYKAFKEVAADGLQFSDAVTLIDKYQTDAAFAKKIDDGILGWEMLQAELADISLFEGLDLVKTITGEFRK